MRPSVFAILLMCLVWPHSLAAQSKIATYKTKYYTLHTDLDEAGVKEAKLRTNLMAEEYARRTKGFAGTVNKALPFYLFTSQRDYLAAGGLPNTAGVFVRDPRGGDKLMAWVLPEHPEWSWHVIQHEGFHQFLVAAVGDSIPPWTNEGLAEYFGFGVFTGDDFRTGLIPQTQLEAVRTCIKEDKFVPLADLFKTDQEIWNSHIDLDPTQAGPNYVQAWSVVYFLAHADDGKHQKPFNDFLREVSKGKPATEAWKRYFGQRVDDLEKRWKTYWLELPDDPTADGYAEAAVATLTSFLARSASQRQVFTALDAFLIAAQAGQLRSHPDDWIPPALLKPILPGLDKLGKWTLAKVTGRLTLTCERPDGTKIEGTYKLRGDRVQDITVVKRDPRKKR